MDSGYSRERFVAADVLSRSVLCRRLARQLRKSLAEATDFHSAVRHAVERLRDLGHDLCSIDESDDFEVWGPNYESPGGPGIVITVRRDDGVEVEWTDS